MNEERAGLPQVRVPLALRRLRAHVSLGEDYAGEEGTWSLLPTAAQHEAGQAQAGRVGHLAAEEGPWK